MRLHPTPRRPVPRAVVRGTQARPAVDGLTPKRPGPTRPRERRQIMTENTPRPWPEAGSVPPPPSDEGGLRAPAHYGLLRKAWWWFDFLILVKLARLRFLAILAVIGAAILYWDTLVA